MPPRRIASAVFARRSGCISGVPALGVRFRKPEPGILRQAARWRERKAAREGSRGVRRTPLRIEQELTQRKSGERSLRFSDMLCQRLPKARIRSSPIAISTLLRGARQEPFERPGAVRLDAGRRC